MKQISKIILTGVAMTVSISVMADIKLPKTKASMETCMKAALAKHDGELTKLELKIERGTPTYEFEILSKDGKSWELECDANKGKITEEEQEGKFKQTTRKSHRILSSVTLLCSHQIILFEPVM